MENGYFDFFSSTAFYLLAFFSYIFTAVVEWRILTKAGEPGWKSLIPFYNIYVSHHIAGMHHVWFVLEMIVWIAELLLETIPGIPFWIEDPATIITLAFTMVSETVHLCLLGTRFGKKVFFKIGMVLLPIVFTAILAFGSSVYQKPEK